MAALPGAIATGNVAGNVWLNRFAWFTAATTLLLICSGGMVTSKNAGLAVPDWPTTFGYNMFLFPASKWVGGILFEHTHRLIASTVGLLTLILAIWIWRVEQRHWVRVLGLVAVIGVILQGVLGGLRVTLLKDQIGVFHACLAQAFFGLLVVIALSQSQAWRNRGNFQRRRSPQVRAIALATTIVIYLQLGLGAVMRHQHRDLSVTDFPTAYGRWIPKTDDAAIARINSVRDSRGLSDVTAGQIWLQMVHRFVAVVITAGVLLFFIKVRAETSSPFPRLSGIWMLGVLIQVTLGAWTIWSNKAADIATAHVAMGAIMLGLGVTVCAFCFAEKVFSARAPIQGAIKA